MQQWTMNVETLLSSFPSSSSDVQVNHANKKSEILHSLHCVKHHFDCHAQFLPYIDCDSHSKRTIWIPKNFITVLKVEITNTPSVRKDSYRFFFFTRRYFPKFINKKNWQRRKMCKRNFKKRFPTKQQGCFKKTHLQCGWVFGLFHCHN